MDEKKTFKQQVKDWWQENKRVIKTGVVVGAFGVFYGFVKGVTTTNEMWFRNGFGRVEDYVGDSGNEAGLTEENCDDPELLQMVKNQD